MATPFRRPSGAELLSAPDAVPRWKARLFGEFRLLAADGSDATPLGRKGRALVAYLLATQGDGTTRERLAALLWSERGEEQARASLRQTFYDMRRLGGTPFLALERERIRIAPALVETDFEQIEDAARADDAATLVDLVGDKPADFLPDLDGVDPVFDDWLAVERVRRRDARRRLLLDVAERCLRRGEAVTAGRLADRLLAADPADEAAGRVAMEASHRRGDRDGVRRIHAALQDALARQIDAPVSEETDALYRRLLLAPVLAAAPQGVEPAPTTPSGQPESVLASLPTSTSVDDFSPPQPDPLPARPSWRPGTRGALVVAALALAVVAGVGLAWHATPSAAHRLVRVEPIRVVPGDTAARPLAVGFSAEVARLALGQDGGLAVRDAEGTASGSLRVVAAANSDDRLLHVDVRVLSGTDDTILWSGTFARAAVEVDALREQVAAKVADVLTCALDSRHTTPDMLQPDTLRLLLVACDARRNETRTAAHLFGQVVALHPDYAHGWAAMAVAAVGDDDPPGGTHDAPQGAEAYATRALALDPHEGQAYAALAWSKPGVAHWSERVGLLREGLRIDPNESVLPFALADELVRVGYWQEAVAMSREAVRLDPLSPLKATQSAQLLGMGGSGGEANVAFAAAGRRFSRNHNLALAEFRYAAFLGDHRRAMQILGDPERGFHLEPDRQAMWAALIAARIDPSPERERDAEAAFLASLRVRPRIDLETVEKLAFRHRVDEAYAYAAQIDPHDADNADTELLFSAATRPLREDPRFMTLAAQLGLVAIWRDTDHWPDFCADPSLGYDCRAEAARALSQGPRPLVARR